MSLHQAIKLPRDPLNRAFYLPRLAREHYQGDAVVFWTLTLFDKAQGWLKPEFHQRFRELMLHAAAREGLLCPVYCLMPDHLHLVWMGLRLDTDQINGMAFLRTYLEPELSPAKFQPQPHDEVLRGEQRKRNAFAKVCFYITANPVRAELITESEVWPYTGCVVPGYPKLQPLAEVLADLQQTAAAGRWEHQATGAPMKSENKVRDSSRRLLRFVNGQP